MTTAEKDTYAKPLLSSTLDNKVEKLPSITMHNVDVEMEKDCWLNMGEEQAIQTIGKSSTDEYLNCSSVNVAHFNPED